jgi:GntR family transcriptional regulator
LQKGDAKDNFMNRISADKPAPLYHQVYRLLKTDILNGTLHFGEKLPSEESLTAEFSVSRITVQRALNELASEGLVDRARGKGTKVIYKFTPKPVQAPLLGVLEEIDSIASESTATILGCRMHNPPHSIGAEFGLKADDKLLHLIRTRTRAGEVFGYFESWTAGVDVPEDINIFVHSSRHLYYRKCGVEFNTIRQTLSATAADETVADLLEMEAGSPLIHLTRSSYMDKDDGSVLVDRLKALYNPTLFQYQMELKVD